MTLREIKEELEGRLTQIMIEGVHCYLDWKEYYGFLKQYGYSKDETYQLFLENEVK